MNLMITLAISQIWGKKKKKHPGLKKKKKTKEEGNIKTKN